MTATLQSNRLVKTFAALRSEGKTTLVPFLTAGYPSLEVTAALLAGLESRGVRIVELGIPFSDPIADGPTIQASYTEALAAGVTSDAVFEVVRTYRSGGGEMALAAMVSYSIVYRHGVESYLRAAARAGFDGLIVPDLPLEEAGDLEPLASAAGLANVMLIAPTSPPDRRLEIAKHSRGFIYYISVAGITGERDRLPEETTQAVAELRTHTDTPICVGFGISNPQTVAHVCEVADGAIVGSAIIHRITDGKDLPADELVARVGDFVAEMIEPVL
ncbi:MAG: tryptophan synthase subunit alpha [Planctomycetota bacterium]|jgi:tryptophan synthase alpha chain